MYDRWSLREIWLQSVSSSISRLRFAEQGPHSLQIRIYCSLLKSGSQLSQKSERLHHPTGHTSAVCRTFEMTYVCGVNGGRDLSYNGWGVWINFKKVTICDVDTFAASFLNTQGLNNSCLKSPASTLVDLTFQSRALRSFSLNQLCNLSL